MKTMRVLPRLLLLGVGVLLCLLAMHSTAQADDVIENFASFLDTLGPANPYYTQGVTGPNVREARDLFTCIEGGKDVGECVYKIKDTQLGQKMTEGASIPSWAWTMLGMYVAFKNKDFWYFVEMMGLTVMCGALNFFTTVDVCGLIADLVQAAEAVYDAAKAVVEFFGDFGKALVAGVEAVGCWLGLGGCDDSSPPPPPPELLAYVKYFQPSVTSGAGLAAIEEPYEGTFENLREKLIKQAAPEYGVEVAAKAAGTFHRAVNEQWTGDVAGRVLSELAGKRTEFNNETEVALQAWKAWNDYSEYKTPKTLVPESCDQHFSYTLKYEHFDRWIKWNSQNATALGAQSNTQWCTQSFWDAHKAQFATRFLTVLQNTTCPGVGQTRLCKSVADYKKCVGVLKDVGEEKRCSLDAAAATNCPAVGPLMVQTKPKSAGPLSGLPPGSQGAVPGKAVPSTATPAGPGGGQAQAEALSGVRASTLARSGQAAGAGTTDPSTPGGSGPSGGQALMCPSLTEYKSCLQVLQPFHQEDRCGFAAAAANQAAADIDQYFKTHGAKIPWAIKQSTQANTAAQFVCKRPAQWKRCDTYNTVRKLVTCVVNESLDPDYKALRGQVQQAVANLNKQYNGPPWLVASPADPLLVFIEGKALPPQLLTALGQSFGFKSPPSSKPGFDIYVEQSPPAFPFDGLSTPTAMVALDPNKFRATLPRETSEAMAKEELERFKQGEPGHPDPRARLSLDKPVAPSELGAAKQFEGAVKDIESPKGSLATKAPFAGTGPGASTFGGALQGGAQTQTTPMSGQVLPDITVANQLAIAARTATWNRPVTLDARESLRTANGLCAFTVRYSVLNAGKWATGTFGSVWSNSATPGAWERQWATIPPGGSSTQTDTINLRPGPNTLTLTLDPQNQVKEGNEGNNQFQLPVTLTGTCGGPPRRALPIIR